MKKRSQLHPLIIIGIIITFSEKNIIKGALPKKLGEHLNSGYVEQNDDNIPQ